MAAALKNVCNYKSFALTDIFSAPRRFASAGLIKAAIRYLNQGLGLGLAAGTVVLALILVSYSPADPAQNFATGAALKNLFGQWGANLADTLYRAAGYAALFPIFLLAAWAWRLLTDSRLRFWRLRLALLPIAWAGVAIAFAILLSAGPWGLGEGPGGWLGSVLLAKITPLVDVGSSVATTGFCLVALALALFVLAPDLDELRLIGRSLRRASVWTAGRVAQRLAISRPSVPRLRLPAISWRSIFRRKPAEQATSSVMHESMGWAAPTASPPRTTAEAPLGDGTLADDWPEAGRLDDGDDDAQSAAVIDVRVGGAPKPARGMNKMQQPPLPLGDAASFSIPPVTLLQEPKTVVHAEFDRDHLTDNARMLESVLEDFGVRGEIMTVRPGPVVTLYELQPAPGTKASRVIGLADDIARNMSAVSVRIATIRGKNAIGIELPNQTRETVYMRELLGTAAYEKAMNGLPLILGKDIGGQPVIANLERMPHLLIAGTTGSGKSVAINTMILSLVYALTPEQCRFIMVDPKMLELSVYDDIPHLLTPVVTDPRKAVVALKWAVREMENRYRAMSTLGVRNIKGYNEKIAEAVRKGEAMTRRVQTGFDPETGEPAIEEQRLDMRPLPYIVIIVDEMADLMLVAGKDIEAAIQRLAQMARAAGIHLIMATQRPSVDVITGTIKANFPTRISFQVTSKVDSRTILGEGGAEQLLGQGDMLHMAGGGRIQRAHGPFVDDDEVSAVSEFLRSMGEPDYVDSVTEDDDIAAGIPGFGGESGDDLYDQAVNIVLRERKASTSFLQRHLKIGYNRAASLIDRMEAEGVISSANHVGKREVLPPASGDLI